MRQSRRPHLPTVLHSNRNPFSLKKKKKKRRKNKYALWESRRMGFPVYLLSLSLFLISCTAAVLFAWHPLADNAQVKLQLCRSRNSQGEQARRRERERERERTTRKPSQKERWKLTIRLFFFFHRYYTIFHLFISIAYFDSFIWFWLFCLSLSLSLFNLWTAAACCAERSLDGPGSSTSTPGVNKSQQNSTLAHWGCCYPPSRTKQKRFMHSSI